MYQKKYHDFAPTLGNEKLWERDKIKINDETLRLWLIAEDIEYQVRKKRPHRQWRERKESFDEMLQLDGLRHKWFEERGPESVLLCCIDYATGEPFGRFYEKSMKVWIVLSGIVRNMGYRRVCIKTTRPEKTQQEVKKLTVRRPYIPPKDNSWRQSMRAYFVKANSGSF